MQKTLEGHCSQKEARKIDIKKKNWFYCQFLESKKFPVSSGSPHSPASFISCQSSHAIRSSCTSGQDHLLLLPGRFIHLGYDLQLHLPFSSMVKSSQTVLNVWIHTNKKDHKYLDQKTHGIEIWPRQKNWYFLVLNNTPKWPQSWQKITVGRKFRAIIIPVTPHCDFRKRFCQISTIYLEVSVSENGGSPSQLWMVSVSWKSHRTIHGCWLGVPPWRNGNLVGSPSNEILDQIWILVGSYPS